MERAIGGGPVDGLDGIVARLTGGGPPDGKEEEDDEKERGGGQGGAAGGTGDGEDELLREFVRLGGGIKVALGRELESTLGGGGGGAGLPLYGSQFVFFIGTLLPRSEKSFPSSIVN